MKKFVFLLVILTGTGIATFSQNTIIAGQTSGSNIHYTDYLPDSSIYLGQNDDGFMLDLDHNGTSDLLFNIGVINWLPNELWTWSTVQVLADNIEIRLNDHTSGWIDNVAAGDTLSETDTWSNDPDTLYYMQQYYYWTYPPPGGEISDGEFGAGYMGFRMMFPGETFYGWIHVTGGNFSITASESAICGLTVGSPGIKNTGQMLSIHPNPFTDHLTVVSTPPGPGSRNIELIDMRGKTVLTYAADCNQQVINTVLLAPGLYLVRLLDEGRIVSQKKVLKV